MAKDAARKSPIILDGAMGTELERRGFNARLPLWSAWALIEAPDLIRRIHCDYVLAGAQVLTAATFRTTRHTLAKEHLEKWAGELNRLAIRLAREAAGDNQEIKVAGSIAPLEDCYCPEKAPPDEVLRTEHAYTVGLMAEAGADLILVETQNSAREAIIAAECAMTAGLPVWVSLMPRSADEMWNGDSLAATAQPIAAMGVDAVLINCCPPSIASAAFQTVRTTLPKTKVGIYPNLADPQGKPWEFTAEMNPAAFFRWAQPLMDSAAILGGCCGTTPEHIASLTERITNLEK